MLRELGFVVGVVWVPFSCIDTMKWSWVAVVTMWSENQNLDALGLNWTVGDQKQHDRCDEYGYHDKSGFCDISVMIHKISGMIWKFWIILSLSWFSYSFSCSENTLSSNEVHFTVFLFCSQTAWFHALCRHDDFPDCLDPTTTVEPHFSTKLTHTFLWLSKTPHFSMAEQKNTLFCSSRLVSKKASSWGGEVNLPDQTCLLVNKKMLAS